MRCSRTLACCSSLLLGFAAAAHAQQPGLLPSTRIVLPPSATELTPQQGRELHDWLAAMQKWQRFEKRWNNEPAHSPFGRITARRPEPAAPDWLNSRCRTLSGAVVNELAGPLGQACRIEAGFDVDLQAEAIRATTLAARADHEKVEKDSFLSRIHLDGLWSTTSTEARFYGLVGSHISLVDVGRVQFFGPPGVILLTIPDGTGSRQIRVGYTWGMSVRLADVRVFAPSRNLTLFFSMTKCWLVGSRMDGLNMGGFDIAGFSLAPRRKRH